MKSIIFICLGNICRSSLAEGVAKKRAKELGLDITIESAGLSTYHNGENPCSISVELGNKHGVDISKQVSHNMLVSSIWLPLTWWWHLMRVIKKS